MFLWLCGLFTITGATALLLGFPEQLIARAPAASSAVGGDGGGGGGAMNDGDSTSIEGIDMIPDKYSKMADVLSLPPVRVLILCLLTMQVRA